VKVGPTKLPQVTPVSVVEARWSTPDVASTPEAPSVLRAKDTLTEGEV
jgi:hypothetical protein